MYIVSRDIYGLNILCCHECSYTDDKSVLYKKQKKKKKNQICYNNPRSRINMFIFLFVYSIGLFFNDYNNMCVYIKINKMTKKYHHQIYNAQRNTSSNGLKRIYYIPSHPKFPSIVNLIVIACAFFLLYFIYC